MSEKKQIELLVCKCKSCTHWEIGRDMKPPLVQFFCCRHHESCLPGAQESSDEYNPRLHASRGNHPRSSTINDSPL